MKTSRKIIAAIVLPFALVAGVTFDYHYEKNKKREQAAPDKAEVNYKQLRDKYDREVIPALLQVTLNICGEKEARMHGLLAAKFIYDSNANDDVRQFLKSKNVDPHHYGTHQLPGGDGYMSIENAHKLAAYLLKENIAITAEPDRHNGQRQLEYLNNGTGGGRLVFYYQPAPSDYDGKNKPWISNEALKIPSDGIYVPMSPALNRFLLNLMNGQYKDIAVYRVMKTDNGREEWDINIKKLVMDGPAAPIQVYKPNPKP